MLSDKLKNIADALEARLERDAINLGWAEMQALIEELRNCACLASSLENTAVPSSARIVPADLSKDDNVVAFPSRADNARPSDTEPAA